ncbi:hypothetical protein [Marinirhabdus gelatinilytica]|uniref:Lipoprotein n=1 Tax=Marinirhabdus gelatinilytica TaxID=1703343 RepID=A0A370Q326_9FLAO|nr:hypothetical protein [Marinirhabdus gelatinilytica]RDK82763.1 hypothetical protein C8D94_1141 [Marinirhabdus gelatinilytica]
MKKTLLYIISITFLVSCNQKPELNRKDVKSVPEYLINAIQTKDTLSFLKLFDYTLDPNISDSLAVKNLNLRNFGQAYETFKDQEVEYIAYDTKDGLEGGQIIDDSSLNIYVKVNEIFYKLRLTHHTAKDENYFLIFYLNNLSSECDLIKDKPYQPSSMALFPNLNWDSFNGYVFNNVNAVFNNLTEYDIEKIKFRLTIENSEKIVFKQTIISEEPIYKGDIKGINIEELRGVNAGFLLKRGNFDWDIEVLEVEPKPEINPCAKIESLKNKK